MLDFTPDPIALQIGPLPVYWYGIGYALGLAAVYILLTRLAKRAGEDPELVGNGMVIIAIAALVGGRLYHVIDQWALYKDDLLKIVLPPYTGLGVYGGILSGLIVLILYTRSRGLPFWRWADIVAPSLFLMQAVARWGNFFNQELYGPPTTQPWGIPIDCAHRIAQYPCADFAFETTRFHPLFLYESVSGLLGMLFLLWVGRRFRARLRPGDLILIFFIWYAAVRFALETLRSDNWTLFGIPTAMIVSLLFGGTAAAVLVWRHRPGRAPSDDPPTFPEVATWGAIGTADWRRRPIDEPWAHVSDAALPLDQASMATAAESPTPAAEPPTTAAEPPEPLATAPGTAGPNATGPAPEDAPPTP